VAVMKNGDGPTVLVAHRSDALPVEEKTGLPYASTVKAKNDAGQDVSVMHACGHDVHMTSMIGTAKVLSQLKDQWHGTLILIGQPAEETVDAPGRCWPTTSTRVFRSLTLRSRCTTAPMWKPPSGLLPGLRDGEFDFD